MSVKKNITMWFKKLFNKPTVDPTRKLTIEPIEGNDDYAMITAVRNGVEYKRRMLVFTDEEMDFTYDLIDKMTKEGRL